MNEFIGKFMVSVYMARRKVILEIGVHMHILSGPVLIVECIHEFYIDQPGSNE